MLKLGINLKLAILCILLVSVPGIILSVVGYNTAKQAFLGGVEKNLQAQANDWKLLVQSFDGQIKAKEKDVHEVAKKIINAQGKMTYELISRIISENRNQLSKENKEEIFKTLSKYTVGKTGYIFIFDYKGNYILSNKRERDGENTWKVKDADGNLVTQKIIENAQKLKPGELSDINYFWIDSEGAKPREKIAALLHFPKIPWVVGISTYIDELVDLDYKEKIIEEAKNLVAKQVIGKTGYIWIVNSKGVYQVSKERIRDGENINEAKDDSGVYFIQEAVKKAKAKEPVNGTDIQVYPWKNKGEKKARFKVAGLSYVKEWDWVIGVSAYYDDFDGGGEIGTVKTVLIIVTILATLIGASIGYYFAHKISGPLVELSTIGRKVAEGNLKLDIPEMKTGDEVEELSTTMSMLVGAIKFLDSQLNSK